MVIIVPLGLYSSPIFAMLFIRMFLFYGLLFFQDTFLIYIYICFYGQHTYTFCWPFSVTFSLFLDYPANFLLLTFKNEFINIYCIYLSSGLLCL